MKAALAGIVLSTLFLIFLPGFAFPLESGHLNNLGEMFPRESRWGFIVVDLRSGKESVSLGNPDELLVPGSLIKLFTAGAALEMEAFGKQLPMTTDILYDGHLEGETLTGNLYLRGNGNCLLTANDLRNSAKLIKEKGIGKVVGQILADATRFDARDLERTRKGTGYAPVSALGMDLHTVSIIVEPTVPGKPPKVMIEPPNGMARFAVAARTIEAGSSNVEVKQIDDSSYRISGNISIGSTPLSRRFPLLDPARYAVGSLRTILKQAGIIVTGDIAHGKSPDGATLLVSIPGLSLHRYITEMNMNSLNVAADNLLLEIGGISGGYPANREMGLRVLKSHLSRHGLSDNDMTMVDGSGLLPGNKITPRAMARYLTSVSKQKWFSDFRNSLPRPGMEGTVKGSAFLNERFRVKTGSLENVTAMAGYGVDKGGREIAFAFIVESPMALPPNSLKVVDEILGYLAEQ